MVMSGPGEVHGNHLVLLWSLTLCSSVLFRMQQKPRRWIWDVVGNASVEGLQMEGDHDITICKQRDVGVLGVSILLFNGPT